MIDERLRRAHQCGIPLEWKRTAGTEWKSLGKWHEGYSPNPRCDYRIAPGIEVMQICDEDHPWHDPDLLEYDSSIRYVWRPAETKPAEPTTFHGMALRVDPTMPPDSMKLVMPSDSDSQTAKSGRQGDLRLKDEPQIAAPTGDVQALLNDAARAALRQYNRTGVITDTVWNDRHASMLDLQLALADFDAAAIANRSVDVPEPADMTINPDLLKGEFVEVPPPEKAPIHQIGETLGLCNGLRAERQNSQFRCAACGRMQQIGSWLVWVPDSVRPSDPPWSVEEAARRNAFNGDSSGWCLACAPKNTEAVSAQDAIAATKQKPKAAESAEKPAAAVTPLGRLWRWAAHLKP